MLSGKIFMITGSTGRLGCEIVYRLEQLGAIVQPIVLNGYPISPKRIEWKAKTIPIIVKNSNDLHKLQIPNYVINFHWKVERKLSYTDQIYFEISSNIHRLSFYWKWLQDNLIHRFINISTVKVFSHLNCNPISADTEPRPVAPYGLAKLTAEKFFDAYFQDSAFPVTHLRLCSVSSFGEHPSHLLSQLFASAYGNQSIKINSGHSINIIYIDEVVDLITNAALLADGKRYIVTKPEISVEKIAEKFEKISGRKLNAKYLDLVPGIPDPIFQSDIDTLYAKWIRTISLEDMIKQIIHKNLLCFSSTLSGLYLTDRQCTS